MEGEGTKNDLQGIFDAIKASEDLESRISLVNRIGDSYQLETPDVFLLMKLLITLWEESNCSGVSRCMLHRTILHTATKYLESDIVNYVSQFLFLGTKASMWCRNHFQVTLLVEELHEEQHRSLFYELILDSLSFSSAVISSLTKSPPFGEKVDMLIVENFIFEILSLTKALILELKRIDSIASEALKLGQVVLDAAVKLCRAYYQAIRCKSTETNLGRNELSVTGQVGDYVCHIISITVCTIENLFDIGTFAASGGGTFVTLLNISWKGVVCLLQLDKGAFSEKVDVERIILTLISLTVESLRCAAEAWPSSSSAAAAAALTEAKRTFLPIKFFLINSVRISSEYPRNAMNICREVVRCVLLISSLCIILSKEIHLKAVSEAIAELLEPTSFLLLHTLLNSAEVKFDSKLQILEWLFPHEINPYNDIYTPALSANLDSLFDATCDDIAMPGAVSLLPGKFYLSLNLLKVSSSLRDEILLEISTKLDNLMSVSTNADLFSSVLGLQIPVFSASGPSTGVVWQPMYSFVLSALKTFMIATASSRLMWIEIETFLLRNLFHPHFLCSEIVKELLCFLTCHAENDTASQIFEKLCLLLKAVASSAPSLSPSSPLRKMAGSVSHLLRYAAPATVDQVYTSIVGDEKTDLSSVMYMALLMEGFPLDSLSDKLKMVATGRIISAFVSFIKKNSKELELDAASSSLTCNSGLLGLPVHAMASALCARHIKSSDAFNGKVMSHLLKFTTTVIQTYRNAGEGLKDQYAKLLGAVLELISNAKHLYGYAEIRDIILELQKLFLEPHDSLSQCRPHLAAFLAALSHIQIAEDDENESQISAAIWDLYHLLLTERHWAFVHLAIAAFGYFAARTSCTQLWRFVPSNAALSFDSATGSEARYETFMDELRGFLEKEGALVEASPCEEQLSFLIKEGIALRRLIAAAAVDGDGKCERGKKRKLPDGIYEGIDLLQNGLKAMNGALSHSESAELEEEFLAHISRLKDAISQLVSLSNTHL